MTAREKVLKYINEHKGPFTTKEICNYFLIGEKPVLATFRKLESENKIRRTREANKVEWHKTLNTYAMAFPSRAPAPPVSRTTTQRWSVYDDRSYD